MVKKKIIRKTVKKIKKKEKKMAKKKADVLVKEVSDIAEENMNLARSSNRTKDDVASEEKEIKEV